MRIGLDFDNTIVCYDEAIARLSEEMLDLPKELPRTKVSLRDFLHAAGREQEWTAFQGKLYGPGMIYAKPFEGVDDTLVKLVAREHEICIISHRSKVPYAGPEYDLHKAAYEWISRNLLQREILGSHIKEIDINTIAHFEETRARKIEMIRVLNCDIFVDDLIEVLLDREFPPETKRILFRPDGPVPDLLEASAIRNWKELALFADRF